MSSTCDAVLSSLRACRQFAEGLEETNVNTIDPSPSSSSKSSTQTKTDSVTISLFTNTRQTLETYISKTGSQRMKQVHIRTVKDAAIVLYNRSKPLTSVPDLAGVMKYVSGLALRLVAHTRLQVCSVFESAAQSFIAAKDRRYSSAAIPANVVGVLDIQLLTCCYYIHHSFSLLPLISFLFSVSNSVLLFFFFLFSFLFVVFTPSPKSLTRCLLNLPHSQPIGSTTSTPRVHAGTFATGRCARQPTKRDLGRDLCSWHGTMSFICCFVVVELSSR